MEKYFIFINGIVSVDSVRLKESLKPQLKERLDGGGISVIDKWH